MTVGSSKVAMRSLLRSHGHLGKERARFQFDITIERIHGLHTGPHTIKWTRGGKVAYTKPFQIERKSKEALIIGQKISLLCTLYRSKSNTNSSNSYDAKDSKLGLVSLKDGKKNEKTIGKIHFNIAQYAGIPSAEACVTFKLNRKVNVDVTISCAFMQLSKASSGSAESNLSGMSASSGEPEDDMGEDDSGGESDNPFSPTTPAPKNAFDVARDIFESGHEQMDPTTDDSTKVRVSLSEFSSGNTERDCPNDPKQIVDRSTKFGKKCDPREDTTFNRKVRTGALEMENISLRREVNETKAELEKCRQLHKVSEDVITELRQALSKNELEVKATRNIHNETLKKKITEMNEQISSIETKAAESAREKAEQIRALHHQVDSMERAKQRVEEKLESAQRDIKRLATVQESCGTTNILAETQRQLAKVRKEKELVESKLSSELVKSQELEQKFESLNSEISRLHPKSQAQSEHSAALKITHDTQSATHENQREKNIYIQRKLQERRDRSYFESLKDIEDESGTEDSKVGSNDWKRGNREVVEIKSSLYEANRKVAQLEAEKIEAQRELTACSTDLQKLKQQLVADQAKHSKLLRDFEDLKTAHLRTQEVLQESSQKSSSVQKRLATVERSPVQSCPMNFSEDLVALSESPPLQQRIVKVLTAASEAKRTIKRMREELQIAYDRDRQNRAEILHLKAIIDKITQEIRIYSAHESKRKEAMKLELEELRFRAENAESSVAEFLEKEVAHREEILKLQAAVESLETKAEMTRESDNSLLAACRKDLKSSKEELQTFTERIESLERELSTKKDIEVSLSARVRELEIESEVIKRQAYHEVEVSKAAAREAERSNNNKGLQIEQYKEEMENLRVVSDNLKMELQREINRAKEEAIVAQQEARHNRKLREEAEGNEKELGQKVSTQKAVIENLRRNLHEAASTSRTLSQKANEESRKAVQVLEEKLALESHAAETDKVLRDRIRAIQELKDRIGELEVELEESNEKMDICTEKATAKLNQKEEEIAEMRQQEEELRELLQREQAMSFAIHEELNLTLKSCAKLSAQRADAVDEVESLKIQLNEVKQENTRYETHSTNQLTEVNEENVRAKANVKALGDENTRLKNDLSAAGKESIALKNELSIARKEFSEFQEEVAALRTQLYELQNKLTASKEASEADMARTAAALEEIKAREEGYKQEIARKEELIEDLTTKLTTAVGKNAADSAMAQAELNEALSREESCKEELQRHKEMLEKMEEELMGVKSASAFTTAEVQADLTEALSREETYRMELKRLKGLIKDLEISLDHEKKNVVSLLTEKDKPCEKCADASESIAEEFGEQSSVELRANRAMADVLGIGGSVSSSNIRKLNVFEKITDARLLEMLVETKMQLALAEEEKLQLEHLIRRIRDGDKHVQEKLAHQASKLELKLTKANQMIDSMQDERCRGVHNDGSGRSSDDVAARERSMMKGGQFQFFRRSSKGTKAKPNNTSEWKQKKEQPRSSRRKPPVDEWDIGDDSDDGRPSRGKSGSTDTSFSARSSGME